MVCCFFFKQKTAYEMRISDWSSDVCSSDLSVIDRADIDADGRFVLDALARTPGRAIWQLRLFDARQQVRETHPIPLATLAGDALRVALRAGGTNAELKYLRRSEEHTSELQSLMRISYAVFCLKKKKKTNQ